MGFFRVGMTRDLLKPDGSPAFRDLELTSLGESDRVACDYLAEDEPEVRPDQIEGCDALVVLGSSITARTLEGADRLAVIARLGVGYDSVDVAACTRASVALTITPDAVRRPVACSALALVLALGHRLLIKDRLTRAGRWAERVDNMGTGLTGRASAWSVSATSGENCSTWPRLWACGTWPASRPTPPVKTRPDSESSWWG